jgi:hypothetical protein
MEITRLQIAVADLQVEQLLSADLHKCAVAECRVQSVECRVQSVE